MSNPDLFEAKIEAMARAFYEARESRIPSEYVPFDDLFDLGKNVWLEYARAAAEAIGLREMMARLDRPCTHAWRVNKDGDNLECRNCGKLHI